MGQSYGLVVLTTQCALGISGKADNCNSMILVHKFFASGFVPLGNGWLWAWKART